MATKQKDKELEELVGEDTNPQGFGEEAGAEDDTETFDFSQVSGIKDGIYHAKVQEFLNGISQNGNPQYEVKVSLAGTGRSLNAQLSKLPSAAWKTGAALRALGVNPGMDGKLGSFKRSDMYGRLCRVEVKNEMYRPEFGEPRMVPKIAQFLPPDEFGATEEAFNELT